MSTGVFVYFMPVIAQQIFVENMNDKSLLPLFCPFSLPAVQESINFAKCFYMLEILIFCA